MGGAEAKRRKEGVGQRRGGQLSGGEQGRTQRQDGGSEGRAEDEAGGTEKGGRLGEVRGDRGRET